MEVTICKTFDYEHVKMLRNKIFHDELGISYSNITDSNEKDYEQFFIKNELDVVGTFRLKNENNVVQIQRMGILEQFRKKGIGRIAINQIIQYCKTKNKSKIILDSINDASGFYEQSGFVRVGNVYEKVGIPHVKMELLLS